MIKSNTITRKIRTFGPRIGWLVTCWTNHDGVTVKYDEGYYRQALEMSVDEQRAASKSRLPETFRNALMIAGAEQEIAERDARR